MVGRVPGERPPLLVHSTLVVDEVRLGALRQRSELVALLFKRGDRVGRSRVVLTLFLGRNGQVVIVRWHVACAPWRGEWMKKGLSRGPAAPSWLAAMKEGDDLLERLVEHVRGRGCGLHAVAGR